MRANHTAAGLVVLAAASGVCIDPAKAQEPPARPPAGADVVKIYGDRQQDDPGSYSVIDAATIEAIQANHAAEILNTLPGVNVQMNSGQEMLIAIRSPVLTAGSGQGSFLVLENGVPIRAPGFGNVNELFETHHETAQAIEVVRGPASVRYGSNAEHGLINVIDPEPGSQTGSMLEASASTLRRYRGDATTNAALGGADVWAGLSEMHDAGWRSDTSVDQQKASIRVGWKGETWKTVASFSAVNLNQDTAGFIIGHDAFKNEDVAVGNPTPGAYRNAWAAHANVRFEQDIGSDQLVITPFALSQRMIFIQNFLPDQSTEKNGQDSGGLMVHYVFGPENVRWTVGVDLQYADGTLEEIQSKPTFGAGGAFPKGIHYNYEVKTLDSAAYGELHWRLGPDWSVLGGVRAEAADYDYTTFKTPGVYGRYLVAPNRTDRYSLFTPKLGAVYDGFHVVSLYANYARGERAPQTSDQYRLQSTQKIARLPVEELDSFEIGGRGTLAGVRYDLAAYSMKKKNFFFRDSDGFNVPNGKTSHSGVEAALSGGLGEGFGGAFKWSGNVTWTDQKYKFNRKVSTASEIITEGNQIDTAPEWTADASVGWENQRFSIFLSSEYIGEYFTDAANLHSYPGHWIAHLRGAWRFSDRLEAFAIIRNVTDRRYADRADFASGQERYFPGEPVNATLGVRARL